MKHVNPEGISGTASACPELTASHRESDGLYQSVIVRLDETRRIINCRDDIQWIVQRRKGRAGPWLSVSYYRRRDIMISHLGSLPPEAREVLEALPAFHP